MKRGAALVFGALALLGCGAAGGEGSGVGSGGSGTGASGGSGGTGGSGTGASTGSGGSGVGGFGAIGGGGDAGSGAAAGAGNCGQSLVARIRDFTEKHPDFESFSGGGLQGIVKADLGADNKPEYASTGPTSMTTGPAEFQQWYHDTAGVNMNLPYVIQLVKQPDGSLLYDNSAFFPIDNKGWGNGPNKIFQPAGHNFLFTTEIHMEFTYKGGEVFTFRGDDDLWVFVNKKLAIDLGGLHSAMEASADFDALAAQLGIVKGGTYPMDIFHAERHTSESNFRVTTTVECFTPVEPH